MMLSRKIGQGKLGWPQLVYPKLAQLCPYLTLINFFERSAEGCIPLLQVSQSSFASSTTHKTGMHPAQSALLDKVN
jgi:hypothetical protein